MNSPLHAAPPPESSTRAEMATAQLEKHLAQLTQIFQTVDLTQGMASDTLQAIQSALNGLAEVIPEPTQMALRSEVIHLCGADDYATALPVASVLAMMRPRDSLSTFLAGTCMQRQSMFQAAIDMYKVSLQGNDDSAIAHFRLAECYCGVGDKDMATSALHHCIERARHETDGHVVFEMANQLLNRIQ